IRSSLSGLLKDEGYKTETAESAEKAESLIKKNRYDLILLDIQMAGKDGITFLEDNKEALTNSTVIIISGKADISTAVMAIKLGSYDFIEKPLSPERVLITVRQALRLSQSLKTEQKLTSRILDSYRIVGDSLAIKNLVGLIEKSSLSDATILITGDNGTGKELVAHQIHYLSARKTESFVTVNCPAIPENLFESELFGHVKGAFTGALKDRVGRFQTASGGTLFLDEIGDIPPAMQAKLLRVLESGQFEKVGSDDTLTSDCRLIAATNRDLEKLIETSAFRQDLYYRLNVLNIRVPSLAERTEDIPQLVSYFLKSSDSGNEFEFSSDAIGVLATYSWPGNIRQLKNFIQQILVTCEPGEITVDDIERIRSSKTTDWANSILPDENRLSAAVRNFERGFLSDSYSRFEGNIAAMARHLNMDRGNLSKKLKALKIV
ncbi:MAG: sigma-54-dependent Fis family transcriptional regulator, partial [candidate division Zixibacteria bacterium]|nr:sigma-54-dependent Fis family transcriptional regulator [candidate division Zixibacteria bacterium]